MAILVSWLATRSVPAMVVCGVGDITKEEDTRAFAQSLYWVTITRYGFGPLSVLTNVFLQQSHTSLPFHMLMESHKTPNHA